MANPKEHRTMQETAKCLASGIVQLYMNLDMAHGA